MKTTVTKTLMALAMMAMTMFFAGCGPDEPDNPTPPTPTTVAVTGVSLNKSSMTLTEGGSETLTATVAPSNATNTGVSWSSSNTGVATVNGGQVTAVKAGTATITVTTADGNKTATCSVTVEAKKVAVTGVKLDSETLELTEGETGTLTATVEPADATNKTVNWSTSSAEVATVADGVVTAVAPGTATIIVTTADGGKTVTCNVTVNPKPVPVEGVSVDVETVEIAEGETAAIVVTVTPEDASVKDVTFASSNEAVATVDEEGNITAVAPGTATITVTTVDGEKTATCEVTVTPKVVPVEGIAFTKDQVSVVEGEKVLLYVSFTPKNASDKRVTWASSDTGVATVDSKGNVTGVKPGTATITVKTTDGEKTATCEVTVTKKPTPVSGVTVNRTSLTLTIEGSAILVATVSPEDAANQNVVWSSSDESIVKVDQNGEVTAVKTGTAKVTATTEDGGKTATCTVTVTDKAVPATGVTLNKKTLSLMESQTSQLAATVAPANATNHEVTWSSSNTAVATVDKAGKITAVKTGTATITAKTHNGKTATCDVTVTTRYTVKKGSTEMTENYNLTIDLGETVTLMPFDKVNNAEIRTILNTNSITSGNSNVASVELMFAGGAGGISAYNGWKITGKKGGSTTVTMKYGSMTRKINVKVKDYTVWYNGKEVGSSMTYFMVAKSEGILFELYDKTSGKKVQLTLDTKDNYTITSSNTSVTTSENAWALYGKTVGCVGEGTTTLTFKYKGVTIKTTSLRIVHDCDIYYNGSKLGSSITAYNGNEIWFKLYDKVDKKYIILHNGSNFTAAYNNLACASTSTKVLRFSGVFFENTGVGDGKAAYVDGVGTSTLTFTYYGKEIARTTITVKEGRVGITTSDYSVYGPLEESSSAAVNFLVYKKNGQKRVFKFYDYDKGSNHKPSSDKLINPGVSLGPGSYNDKFTIAFTGNSGEICFYQYGASSGEKATLYFGVKRPGSSQYRTVYVSLQNSL
ncbi:MAG: Ig-like domain-containing protein [Bacteroidales bacterium]|nr:Ig-like domain-containing protein [Bacteroidales bacterium]